MQVSDFKAKIMHQIRPRWGSLQRSPDLLSVWPTSKGRQEKEEWKGSKERGRGRKGGEGPKAGSGKIVRIGMEERERMGKAPKGREWMTYY